MRILRPSRLETDSMLGSPNGRTDAERAEQTEVGAKRASIPQMLAKRRTES